MKNSQGRVVLIAFSVLVLTAFLIASFWGFVYASSPGSDSCWTVRSWGKGRWSSEQGYWYRGLPGTDNQLAWEESSDFTLLHLLYVFSMLAAGLGLLLSLNLWREKVSQQLKGKHTQAYVGAMIAYFAAGFICTMMIQVCFVRNRCEDHNVNYINYAEYDDTYRPRDGPEWLDVSSSSAKWAKALYLTMNFTGGFLSNTLLELALLRRIIVMEGTEEFAFHIRVVKTFIYGLLVISLLALPITLIFNVKMANEGVEAVGGTDFGDTITVLFNVAAVIYATLHIYISVVLIRVFVTLMRKFSEHPYAVAKVLICTTCAIVSTFIVYGNMAAMLVNAYIMMPLDSLINNICMITLNFTGSYKGEFRRSFIQEGDAKDLFGDNDADQTPKGGSLEKSFGEKMSKNASTPKSSTNSPKNFGEKPSAAFSVKSSIQSIGQMARDAKAALFPSSYANLDEDQNLRSAGGANTFGASSSPHVDLSKLNSAQLNAVMKSKGNSVPGSAFTPTGMTPSSGVPPAQTPLGVADTPTSTMFDVDADEGVDRFAGGLQGASTPQHGSAPGHAGAFTPMPSN